MMRNHRYKLAALVAVMLGAWGFQAGHASGDFSCRASLVHVKGDEGGPLAFLDTELGSANPAGSPCATTAQGGGEHQIAGIGSITLVESETSHDVNQSASADSAVARLSLSIIGVPTIEAEVLSSSAKATCPSGSPEDQNRGTPGLIGLSEVARVAVGTTPVVHYPDGPYEMDLGSIGKIYFNEQVSSDTALTQRAMRIVLNGLATITVAESSVGFTGNPCTIEVPPQCSDGRDNDGDGLVDFGQDLGCDSETDDDETDLVGGPTECSDGVDNDGDGLKDYPADPGCASADDDDETDAAGECSDGEDNTDPEDNLADEDDPDCHTDFNPANAASYDGSRSEGCDAGGTETTRDSGDAEDDLGDVDDEDCSGSERKP